MSKVGTKLFPVSNNLFISAKNLFNLARHHSRIPTLRPIWCFCNNCFSLQNFKVSCAQHHKNFEKLWPFPLNLHHYKNRKRNWKKYLHLIILNEDITGGWKIYRRYHIMVSSINFSTSSAPSSPSLRPNLNFFHKIKIRPNSHQKHFFDTLLNYSDSHVSGKELLHAFSEDKSPHMLFNPEINSNPFMFRSIL